MAASIRTVRTGGEVCVELERIAVHYPVFHVTVSNDYYL